MIEGRRTEWLRKQFRLEKSTRVWEKEILPNWDNVKRSKRGRDMWTGGLPRSIRGKVWFLAFGNRGAITRDLFNIMAERGAKLKNLLKKQSSTEQLIAENGGDTPQSKETLYFPEYKPEFHDSKEAFDAKIARLEKNYATLFKVRKKLSMLISLDEKGTASYDNSKYLAREKSI